MTKYSLKHLPLLQDEKRREGCFCQTLQLCVMSRGRQEKRAICRLPQPADVASAPVNILLPGNSPPLFLPPSPVVRTAAWLSLPTNALHFYHWALWETILPFAYSKDIFSPVLLLLTTPFYPFTFLLSYCLLLLFSLITIEVKVRQASQ